MVSLDTINAFLNYLVKYSDVLYKMGRKGKMYILQLFPFYYLRASYPQCVQCN